MKRQAMTLMLGLTCLTAPALAAPLVDAAGGFSYQPPAGWRVGSLPGAKYKVSYAKPVNAFAPNINVVDETAPMPIGEYARLNLVQLQQRFPGFHLLGQSAFVTNSKIQGVKVMSETAPMGKKLRQTFYLFPGHGSRKLVVTASWLSAQGNKYGPAVDAAMKTFALK